MQTHQSQDLWCSIREILQGQYHYLNLKLGVVHNFIVSDSILATHVLMKRNHRILACENPNSTYLTSLSSEEIEGQRLLSQVLRLDWCHFFYQVQMVIALNIANSIFLNNF